MRLTERVVEGLECPPGKRDRMVFDDIQKGLAVRVMATGSRSYLAQYTAGGQKRRVPLGAGLSLSAAREATRAIIGDVARGRDPAEERRKQAAKTAAEKARLSVGEFVGIWSDLHLATKRPSYRKMAVRSLERAFDAQWAQPAEDLTRATIVRALDAITRKGHRGMAARTASYGRACFSWGMRRGSIDANPFALLPTIEVAASRDRVLTDEELAAVWRAAAAMGAPFGPLVHLLILTGTRRSEAAGMRRSELSADLALWTIPGSRTKNGVPHVVPLSDPAREIISSLPRWSEEFVFAGRFENRPQSGWGKKKDRLDLAAGITDWTLHDLRRTLATGLQRLEVHLQTTEAVLNHSSGSRSGIVAVYQTVRLCHRKSRRT